jgi:hypothetical protein
MLFRGRFGPAWQLENNRFFGPGAPQLFDVELADAFLHPDVFDGVPNFISETDSLRHGIDDNERSRRVGGTDVDVFNVKNALPKRLAGFQIFHAIKSSVSVTLLKTPPIISNRSLVSS